MDERKWNFKPIAKALREGAGEIASGLQGRTAHIHKEYLEAKAHAEQMKAQFDSANFALERAANFPVHDKDAYLCPRCWIQHDRSSPLMAKRSPTNDDMFACLCGYEMTVTY